MLEKSDIPCIICAGGKSSRFGEDKALLFAEYQYRRMQKIFKNVYLSTKENKFNFDAQLLLDEEEIHAPIFALKKALESFEEVFILSVDTPLVTAESIKILTEQKAVAEGNPLIGYYNQSFLPSIYYKITQKRYNLSLKQSFHPIEASELCNINYQEDLSVLKESHGNLILKIL